MKVFFKKIKMCEQLHHRNVLRALRQVSNPITLVDLIQVDIPNGIRPRQWSVLAPWGEGPPFRLISAVPTATTRQRDAGRKLIMKVKQTEEEDKQRYSQRAEALQYWMSPEQGLLGDEPKLETRIASERRTSGNRTKHDKKKGTTRWEKQPQYVQYD